MYLSDEACVRGALFGAAVGDAIGSTFEGCYPAVRKNLEMQGGGQFNLPKGSVTDDTLMTLALGRTFLCCGYFSRTEFLRRMVLEVTKNPTTFGNTTRTLTALLREGCYPKAAVSAIDTIFGSRTNGSVMRTIPVGVVLPPSLAAGEARRVSAFTHADPLAGEASAAVSLFVAELLSGAEREDAYKSVQDQVPVPELYAGELIPSVDAVESVRCAFHCFMHGDNFRDVVESAVSLGGDTDTIGSVAGGLAGAYFGVEEIPESWVVELTVREEVEEVSEGFIGLRKSMR